MNSAAMHPLGTFAARGIEQAVAYRLRGAGPGRVDFGADKQQDLKVRYGKLIGATANEIAYTANTSDGENIVVMGLDLPKRGGNIVIDELHFTTSLYMYKEIEKKGVELRLVKHRNWAIDVNDMDRAIDKNTRLVSRSCRTSTASCTMQVGCGAGARAAPTVRRHHPGGSAVPLDVKRSASTSPAGTYKWLMGERGIGFLYVREDLQGTVLPTTRYGHRQVANFNRAELTWEPMPGAAKYETGGIGVLLAACVSEGINYVQSLGLDKIRAHARLLTDRLQTELPPLGYKPLTPRGTETPILAFELKDAAATAKALHDGKVAGTVIANENRLRLSVSVFNTHDDIDRVVEVLGGGARRRPRGKARERSAYTSVLERQPQPELHLARVLRAEDAAEVPRAEDAARDVEVRAVEEIEDFPAEFQVGGARKAPRLGDRQIHVDEPRPEHAVARGAAERELRRQGEGRGVEPPVGRSIAAGEIRILDLIGTLRRPGADVRAIDAEVHGERRSRLCGENRIDAPPAQHGFTHTTGVGEERQLVDAARDELMPVIEAGVRPLS